MVVIVPRNTEIVRKFLKYRTTRWSCAFEWNETNGERGGNWLRHDTNRETFTTQLYELVIRSISSILRAPKWKYANLWKNKNYKSPFYMLCMKAVWYGKRWRDGGRSPHHFPWILLWKHAIYSHVMAVRDRRTDICMLVTRPSTSAACNFWVWLPNNGACKF